MRFLLGISLLCALGLTACASTLQADDMPMPAASPTAVPVPVSFAQWKALFRSKALAAGIAAPDVDRLLSEAQFQPNIIALDNKQPEFTKFPWQYSEGMLANATVQAGKAAYQANRDLLTNIEQQYGVPAYVLLGIWGVESRFGKITGKTDLASALATLAYHGRRRDFAENQLIALLKLLQAQDVQWSNLQGSWAGGMGQTQFIPTTFLQYGVDGDGDGAKNPWDTADALASTANYLAQSGWQKGVPWGFQVQLPQGFDYHLANQELSYQAWLNAGIQAMQPLDGSVTPDTLLTLWLPAGAQGPALLLSKNFKVIQVYNHSSSYALAVALLGERILGKAPLVGSWPSNETPLSRQEAQQLQQALTTQGYDTQGVDGIIGQNTQQAFQAWQSAQGAEADGFISKRSAQALLQSP